MYGHSSLQEPVSLSRSSRQVTLGTWATVEAELPSSASLHQLNPILA